MEQGRSANKVSLLSNITLESTEAATQAVANRVILDVANSDNLNLACSYTVGASETSNTANITVWGYAGTKGLDNEIIADSDNWFQLGVTTITGGAATYKESTFNIAGATAGTYKAQFNIPITWSKIRIGASETGVATNKGKLTVIATV